MKKIRYLEDLDPAVIESWARVRTHAGLDAPLAASPTRFPLLLFSPGFGISRASYTFLMEGLASHGFVVAAIDHPEPIIDKPGPEFRKMQAARRADWQALVDANPKNPPSVFTVRGTNHFAFTDGPFVMASYVKAQPGRLGDLGRATEAIAAYVRGFLRHVLDRGNSPFPGGRELEFPEVRRYTCRGGTT